MGTRRAPVLFWAAPEETWCPVRFPCGRKRHVIHARCVVEAFARAAALASLRFPAVNCGAQQPRWIAMEKAVQVDPCLRNRAARMRVRTAGDKDRALVRMGLEHSECGATTRCRFLG